MENMSAIYKTTIHYIKIAYCTALTSISITEDKIIAKEEIISPFEIISTRPSFDSLDSERETELEFTPNTQFAIDILREHLQKTSLNAVYKHIHASGTGHLIEHTYSCSVANLSSEGKSRKKSKAKEEAATQMLRQLIERHNCNRLPLEIAAFAESQISQILILLDEREDFTDQLEKTCLQMHELPPLYTVLSENGRNNDPAFTIKCEAMGYTAVGHGSNKVQAKKNSAKSILNLVSTQMNSK